MAEDIRWKQRLNNYSKALGQLTRFVEKGELNEFEQQGLIQSFEYSKWENFVITALKCRVSR